MIKIIIILGESGSGKSTIEKALKSFSYEKIISYTTREPRNNEIDGADYHFISKKEFNKLSEKNFFAEVGCYRGWYYGSASEDCTDKKVAVLTPHGMRQLKKVDNLKIYSFYIKVPRRDRLIKLLQRGDDIEEAYRRSVSDIGMFDGIEDEVDHIIDNNGYDKTPLELASIIHILSQEEK